MDITATKNSASSTTITSTPIYNTHAKRILVISNLITIAVTATAVLLALHFNNNNNNNNNQDNRNYKDLGVTHDFENRNLAAAACCDCTSGLPLTPTKAPTAAPSGGFCFPKDATVLRQDGTIIPLHSINIGDFIHIENNRFEPIYSFGHYNLESWSNDFITMTTSTTDSKAETSSLTLSTHHMVYKCPSNNHVPSSFFFTTSAPSLFIPAFQLSVGDQIRSHGTCVSIKSIQTNVPAQGLMAPFTPSGKMEVNGYLVSNFVSLMDTMTSNDPKQDASVLLSIPLTGHKSNPESRIPLLTAHGGAHVFEFPHRLVCYYLGRCPIESYTKDGISVWVATPMNIGLWILQQESKIIQTILLCLFAIMGACFSMMEFILFQNNFSVASLMYHHDDRIIIIVKMMMITMVVWKMAKKYYHQHGSHKTSFAATKQKL